jgi:hypothetical protein
MTVRAIAALGCALALTSCAPSATQNAEPSPNPAAASVGYVRMDALIKRHPLYAQLARYDDDIAALNLTTIVPQAVAAGPELARREAELQQQLDAAGKRTNDLLQQKSREYQQREEAAIAEALRAAGAAGGGASVPSVAQQMESTARGQVTSAAEQAQRDLDTYRRQLESQDNAQVTALQQTLGARADRTYRAKVDELTSQEAALSLKLATDDAPERLQLRTKLASLPLDDAARKDAQDRLATLDRQQADEIGALHNRNQQTLAALQAQLRSSVQHDLAVQVAAIHAKSVQRLQARENDLRSQFSRPTGPLIATTMQNGKPVTQVNPNLPPALRSRIQQLHDDYTRAFRKDADTTVAEFNKMRDDLRKRYDALHGLDADAARSAQAEIASLQRKRGTLYDQMVAQIEREVKIVAQQHGIAVVLSNVNATSGGVDLTDDALKDIESLHE